MIEEPKGNKEEKLPMFYIQIDQLMKLMAKFYLNKQGFSYLKSLKLLYSRVRPDLKKDQQIYFDNKIKEIHYKYNVERGYSPQKESELTTERSKIMCEPVNELEVELFAAMDEAKYFKYLKSYIRGDLNG